MLGGGEEGADVVGHGVEGCGGCCGEGGDLSVEVCESGEEGFWVGDGLRGEGKGGDAEEGFEVDEAGVEGGDFA